jgi:TolB-like protein/Flp pilus assembly protein TadD
LRSLTPTLDRDLETICAKCLEREPSARYRSAADLAEDLERWLQGRHIVARPVSAPARVWRWARRNPVIAGMSALLLLLGIALGGVLWKGQFAPRPAPSGIAVLPFDNLNQTKEGAFFADGIQDGILTKLAKVNDLKVISRNSVMQYAGGGNAQQIGQALNVSHVLKGSVLWKTGRIHLNAQLIDTRTNTPVWAEEYDQDLAKVFVTQSDIAQKVIDRLGAEVSSVEDVAIDDPPTKDLVAYDLYLRAKHLINGIAFSTRAKEDLFQAVQLLNQAITRDPSFFDAFGELAEAHDRIYFLGFDHTGARLKLAEAAIESVRRLRPGSGETHLTLGQHLYWAYQDYAHASEELAAAQKALPNESRIPLIAGYIDRRQGQWEKSLTKIKQALELDPRNSSILEQISLTYQALRRYKETAATLDAVLAITPTDVSTKMQRAWVDLQWRSDPKPLHTIIDTVLAQDPNAAPVIVIQWLELALSERDMAAAERALQAMPMGGCRDEGIVFPNSWCQGVVARLRGDEPSARAAFTEARGELEQIVREQPTYAAALCALGVVDAALGNKEDAVREGERAVELTPIAESAIDGAMFIQYLGVIYAWTGDIDRSIERLGQAVKLPGSHVTYGNLRLNPFWDPLRGDPRFEAIVASLAPN